MLPQLIMNHILPSKKSSKVCTQKLFCNIQLIAWIAKKTIENTEKLDLTDAESLFYFSVLLLK